MPDEKPKPGMLVEDESVTAGTDDSGATVIRPKTTSGHATEGVNPTDRREAPKKG